MISENNERGRNMEKLHIPIVLASDNNQINAMAVVMTSAIKTADENTFYEFYCLLSSNVSKENIERLLEFENDVRNNCSVQIIDMSVYFQDIDIQYNKKVGMIHSVTTPALYRLKTPSILPQHDKVIYLDTDVLVRHDLRGLYEFPIDKAYLAGVPVVWAQAKKHNRDKWISKSKISGMDSYINSGVLLMNLKEMRQGDVETKCIHFIGKKEFAALDPADQLIINVVCYGKIDFLPCKYNVTLSNMKNYQKMKIFYSEKEIKSSFEDPFILHWTGASKPWKYYDVMLAHEWWRYYQLSPFKNIPLLRDAKPSFWKKTWKLFLKTLNT